MVVVGLRLVDSERAEHLLPEPPLGADVFLVGYRAHRSVAEAAEEMVKARAGMMAAARLHADHQAG